MNYKKDTYKFMWTFAIFLVVSILLLSFYIIKKEQTLTNEIYESLVSDIKKSTKTLINNKKNANTAISIPLVRDTHIINAVKENTFDNLDLELLSLQLKENTNYKNLWLHIFDLDGKSLYKSWLKNENDYPINNKKINLEENKILKFIEVYEFGLGFKALVPIVYKDKTIAYLETITKFNSISKSIDSHGFKAIVIANKKYKDKIIYPFSKKFVGSYYVANVDALDKILNILSESIIDELLKVDNYTILENFLFTKVKIENDAGYILLFKDISSIDTQTISDFKKQVFLLAIFLLIILIFIVVVYSYRNYMKNMNKLNKNLIRSVRKIKAQKNKTQLLLDSQLNIIVITDGEEIIDSNQQLLNFFPESKTLKEFKEKYTCVCTLFVPFENDDSYVLEQDYDGLNWAEYVLANPTNSFKAAMYNSKNELRHFKLNVSQNNVDSFIIVTLTDITNEIKLQKEAKQKDKLIFQQSKMASIAQMLNNIAHQWRQPLNVITTSASSIQLYKQLGKLTDEELNKSCVLIVNKAKYLSNTIEKFRDFFEVEDSYEKVKISKLVGETLEYIDSVIKENKINLEFEIQEDYKIKVYENEFKQALLKILENAIDSINRNKEYKIKVIYVSIKDCKLIIKDSGKGIDPSIMEKVFDPYFTTKHKAQGVGLGLYMVQEILTKQMNFKIDFKNTQFKYRNKELTGLKFIINLKQEN
ncbi:sensor histidine kinase [Arcobacter sp. YIC-80]|uniref:sensor histidine kinase n=1 Tax=Arcobacter sp. YIC-80 TaxID=3376683 RepID=UPI00384BC03E